MLKQTELNGVGSVQQSWIQAVMKHSIIGIVVYFLFITIAAGSEKEALVIAIAKDYHPFSLVNVEEYPAGMWVDIWKLWAHKTGQKIEFLPATWDDTLAALKDGRADIHIGLFRSEDREKWMFFSHPFYEIGTGLFYSIAHKKPKNLSSLSYQNVGAIEGSYQENSLEKKHPYITVFSYENEEQMIWGAINGEVRAFLGEEPVVKRQLERMGMQGSIAKSGYSLFRKEVSAGVLKGNKQLLELVNSGLNQISRQEFETIEARWIVDPSQRYYQYQDISKTQPPSPKTGLAPSKPFKSKTIFSKMIFKGMVTILIVSFVVGLLGFLIWRYCPNMIESLFQSKQAVLIGGGLLGAFLLIIVIIAQITLHKIEKDIRERTAVSLQTVVRMTHESLAAWVGTQKELLWHLSNDPTLRFLTEQHLMVPPNREALLNSYSLNALREFFDSRRNLFGDIGFFIINPDYINIGSMRDSNIGKINLIAKQRPQLLQKAFGGELVFILPVRSDVMLANQANTAKRPPSIFFAAPIKSVAGEVLAVVTLRVDFNREFSRLTQIGQIGKSGETYAFDRNGILISDIRFDKDMQQTGLLEPDEPAILNLRITDPGGNLLEGYQPSLSQTEQPLTLMARHAVSGKPGVNVDGYRDYRGIMVLGAWLWNPHLGFGLTTEIDETDALQHYYTIQMVIIGALAVTTFLALMLMVVTLWSGIRANRTLTRSRDELEEQVKERTTDLTHEIQERKRSEKALQTSELRFRNLVEGFQENYFFFSHNLAGMINYASPSITQILGYSPEEALIDFKDFFTSNSVNEKAEFHLEVTTHGIQQPSFECEVFHKDGSIRWLDISEVLTVNESDQVIGVEGIAHDITERKKAAAQLKEREENLEMLIESIPFPLGITSVQDKKIVKVNQASLEFNQISRDDYLNADPKSMYAHPEDRLKILNEFNKHGRVDNYEFLAKRLGTGEERWVYISLYQMTYFGQYCFVSIFFDNTERKKEQEELRIAKDQAEKATSAAEKTAERLNHYSAELEWKNREMEQARQIAEEATQAKSDFLANMSHEIRTPMNAIMGLTHLCLKTEMADKQRDYLNKVYSSATSLLGIINDILDFSKIEAGKLEIESVDFNLNDVLDNVSNLITIKAQEKGLEFLFKTETEIPWQLIGDPLRLGQILINLANNAVKFTQHGEIVISIEMVSQTADSLMLQFTVRDTGIGLSKEQIGKLFQSFSQADSSTTRKFGGTGLGLSISKQLVEMMKGQIWVESLPGEGSSFIFTAVFGLQGEQKNRELLNLPADLEDMHVLVVDDNKTSRLILFELLESIGLQVTLASSGEEALTEIEKADVAHQLILMDWQMPGMDGLQTSKKIKEYFDFSSQPKIVLFTAFGREEVMQQAELIGFDGFLLKPVTASALLDTIISVFGKETRSPLNSTEREVKEEGLQRIRGSRILLVEDNEINQQVAMELLTGAGLLVEAAMNGHEAVERVNKEQYDTVLMDIQMPVMDGYEATRIIRQNPEFEELPVIAMTANALLKDREKALESGMNDHVAKPIDPEQLFATLLKWIKPGTKEGDAALQRAQQKRPQPSQKLPKLLPGLDITAGLRRIGGNPESYRNLLKTFAQNQAQAVYQIKTALSENDMELASRLSHTLKGVSGNIGAMELHEASLQLETAIKKNKSNVPSALIDEVQDCFNQVLSSINKLSMEDQPMDTSDAKPVDLQKAIPVFKELKELLEQNNTQAEEVLDSLLQLFSGEDLKKLKQIGQALDVFQFKQARVLLQQIIAEFNLEI
ncbi:MAG: response regulator [SAR324 cluster bacterium]|nr:response regulator [SAR324 cluster bacterium]